MRLPPQLRVALGPSRQARAFIAAVACSSAVVLALLPLPPWGIAPLEAAIAVWASWRWRAFGTRPWPGRPAELALTADRVMVVRNVAGALRAGIVRDATYVSPSLTSIVWKPDGARRSEVVLVLPDMLPADDFRRLRVLLRYGRSEEVAGAPASHA